MWELRTHEKLRRKIALMENRTLFLKNCLLDCVAPKSLDKIKERDIDEHPFPTLVEEILKEDIKKKKIETEELRLKSRQTRRDLIEKYGSTCLENALKRIEECVKVCVRRSSQLHEKRLNAIFDRSGWVKKGNFDLVSNISKRLLSRDEVLVLGYGLNFCMGNDHNEFIDICKGLRELDKSKNGEEAAFCRGVLWAGMKSNRFVFPDRLRKALTRLSKYKDIRICKADKGGAVVVMDALEYEQKMCQLLSDENTYSACTKKPNIRDIQNNFNKRIRDALTTIKDKTKRKDLEHRLKSEECPEIPHIYGSPKIHKEGCPLRPIVASLKSPQRRLEQFLSNIMSKWVGLVSKGHLKHSMDLIQEVSKINVKYTKFASLDVTSLFTNVPVKKTIEIIKNKMEEGIYTCDIDHGAFIKLLETALSVNVIEWGEDYFVQKNGVAMGSSLSPILANLFMEWLETEQVGRINKGNLNIIKWVRYVDDILIIYKGERVELIKFTDNINKINENIKFTLEEENEGEIPFLDVLLKREGDNLHCSVYRKKTHTNSYIHMFSSHRKEIKMGILTGLIIRAYRICSPLALEAELVFLRDSFSKLGYPGHWWVKAHYKARKSYFGQKEGTKREMKRKGIIVIPDNNSITALNKKLDQFSLIGSFKNTIRNRIVRNKKRTEGAEIKGGVYMASCRDCELRYYGQSGKSCRERSKQHMQNIKYYNQASAVAKHCWERDHKMDWDNMKFLYKSKNKTKRLVVEYAMIKSDGNSLPDNTGCGFEDRLSREIIYSTIRKRTDKIKKQGVPNHQHLDDDRSPQGSSDTTIRRSTRGQQVAAPGQD